MAFQSSVRNKIGAGVAGELAFEGPLRAKPGMIQSTNPAANIISRAFTTVSEEVMQAGGAGVFAGLLANPKVYPGYGTQAGGAFAPTMTVPNGIIGEFVDMGIMFVLLPAAAAIGDVLLYNTTTGADAGALSTMAPGGTPPANTAIVPNARVSHFTVATAGLAVVTLTN